MAVEQRHAATLTMSRQLLIALLGWDPQTRIVDVHYSGVLDGVRITIEHPALPVCTEGAFPVGIANLDDLALIFPQIAHGGNDVSNA
jgi:hypothetical protein